MTILEERRSLQEDLEIIENGIAERFQRNPELYYHNLPIIEQITGHNDITYNTHNVSHNIIYKAKKVKRSRKQIMAQEHEIKLFLADRNRISDKLKTLNALPVHSNIPTISEFKQSFTSDKTTSDQPTTRESLRDKISKYSMLYKSTNNGKAQSVLLSHRAQDIDINKIFSREEQYGEFLDLDRLYGEWINVIKNSECSLLQFLTLLENLFIDEDDKIGTKNYLYLLKPPMDRKNGRYMSFIEKLSRYLQNYLYKSYPLLEPVIENNFDQSFTNNYVNKPIEQTDASGRLFCVVCGKNFANMAVFENHINGKNHKKNLQKRETFYYSEFKVKRILNILKNIFDNTKSFTERKLAFTINERKEELERMTEIYNAPIYNEEEEERAATTDASNEVDATSSTASILDGSFDMPLGPDGMPMPYWLYKLQGLDVKYICEICSNRQFQGRRVFEKHFHEPTHEYHLKCLGITPSSVFKGITDVKEAQLLWRKINSSTKPISRKVNRQGNSQTKSNSHPPSTIKMDVEVEDEDGNVMTQQVYNDLKKQGLL